MAATPAAPSQNTSLELSTVIPPIASIGRETVRLASRIGLGPEVGAPGFDTALQAITARIGATADGVVHNKANRLLADGCGRLGYPWKTIPQNLADGGKGIANGWTAFGSRDGNKQGTLVTYLADAAAAGARVVAASAR